MNAFTQPAGDLADKSREYIDLRLDEVKLTAARGLSLTASKLVSLILIVGAATNFVLVLSFGLILLLGEITGSYAWSALGIALLLGIVLAVLVRKRESLFKDSFVPLFIHLFFDDESDEGKE